MNSYKESSLKQLQTRERGLSMGILGNGLLRGLVLILLMAPLSTAFGGTSLMGIEHEQTQDGDVNLYLKTSGDVQQVRTAPAPAWRCAKAPTC